MSEMSGETKLEQQLDSILDEYCEGHKVKPPNLDLSLIEEYLSMERDFIENLSKESRYSISLILAQYALYIQRLINREKARLSWANAILNSAAAQQWNDYDQYLKYEIKIELIAKENPLVKKGIAIRNNAQIRVDELDRVSSIVERMANILEKSGYGKSD